MAVVTGTRQSFTDKANERSSMGKFPKPPARKGKAHPGFAGASASIAAKEGVSQDRADAILAASTRRAGAAAKRRNPRLKRVKGKG